MAVLREPRYKFNISNRAFRAYSMLQDVFSEISGAWMQNGEGFKTLNGSYLEEASRTITDPRLSFKSDPIDERSGNKLGQISYPKSLENI